MSRFRSVVIAALTATFLVYVPTASEAAPGDPITGATASQCANNAPPSTSKACPGGWIGSILQASNSHYREDEVVPQRLLMNIPSGGDSHTVTISYLARKGSASAHAFDSLATWNHTQDQAQPCQGLAASLCAGSPSSLQMASDSTAVQPVGSGISAATSAHQLSPGAREWKMYGAATITSTSAVTHSNAGNPNQDDEASVTLTIAGSSAGGEALLLFGGHLAVSGASSVPRAWGTGMGASFVSGGPYHIGLSAIDGKKVTAQNNVQAGAVQALAPANFTVEKTADDLTATPGQEITYTVAVKNTGEEAGSTTFVDDISDQVDPSGVTTTPSGGTCTEATTGDRKLTCETSSIPAGGTQTFTYKASMPATFTGTPAAGCDAESFPIVNTVTLANNQNDAVTVCVEAASNFTIEKVADDETAEPGQDIEYSVTVKNTGTSSGTTSFVDDFDDTLNPGNVTTVPSGGTCVETTTGNELLTCETSSIAPGDTQTFTYTATMPETFEGESGTGGCETGSFPITNTATLAGDVGDDSVTVCVAAAPEFTIEKVAGDDTSAADEGVEYTVTVTNTGSTAGSTTFVDAFDADVDAGDVTSAPEGGTCAEILDTLSCQTTSLAPGDSQTFTYTATMPETFEGESGTGGCDSGSFPVTNTATLDGEAGDDSVTVCVAAAPKFTIEKIADDETAGPGDEIEYTITVSNNGSTSGSTTFEDDFEDSLDPGDVTSDPEGGTCVETTTGNEILTCETSSIAPGGTQTFTYTAILPETFEGESGTDGCDPGSFSVTNTATLDGGAGDDSATVCVAAAPKFTIEKVVGDQAPVPGGDVEYTITVGNTGSTAGSTSFVDNFEDRLDPGDVTSDPEGGSCVETTSGDELLTCDTSSIAPGDSQTFTYTATLPETFEGESGTGGCESGFYPITNTAVLFGDAGEDSVTVCVPAAPKFTIEKSVVDDTATPGEDVEYTITVGNTGSTAGSTSFVDNFEDSLDPGDVTSDPEGGTCVETTTGDELLTCETSSIAPGDSQTFTYTAAMPETFEGESGTGGCESGFYPVNNTATLDGDGGDSSVTVCVEAEPEFTIEKSAVEETATPGEDVEYTITVTNNGSTSGSTSFVDDFADRLDPSDVTSDPAGGSCVETTTGNEILTCQTSSIAPGATQTFTYTAAMPDTFEGESGTDGCESGFYPIDNTATLDGGGDDTVTVCVEAASAFAITKTADDDSATPGQEVQYTITVENTGSTSGSTSFVDNFEDSLDPGDVTSDPEGGTCVETTTGDELLTCETSSIAPGDAQTFTYTATMPETFEGESGTDGCDTGSFPISNIATLDGEAGDDTATVCVAAAPKFTIEKTVDDETGTPGQQVEYTITVKNIGSADGSTTFVDDFDDDLQVSLPNPDGNGTCEESDDGNRIFNCETGTMLGGSTQTFTYAAVLPLTYSEENGPADCPFRIINTVTIDENTRDGVIICVDAAPELTVTKSASESLPAPGEVVTYTVTVKNGGSAPGGTTFVDDFDDVLDPSTVEVDSDGGSCTEITTGNQRFECETGSIPAGGVQTFTYTAAMPDTFSGASGEEPCEPGGYPVANTVTPDGGEPQTVTVCVQAAPDLELEKSVETDFTSTGEEFLTYTLEYTNNGPAEAPSALIHDEIPTGTVFEECSEECDTTNNPVSSATWAVGPIAPEGGTGKVTLIVRVDTKEACEVTNVATIQFGLAEPISSNTVVTNVTPKADPAGAHARGSSIGAQVLTSGLLNLPARLEQPISSSSTSQTGLGTKFDDEAVLSIKVPGNGSILKTDVLRTTSGSVVTPSPAEARHTSTAEVAKVCVVPIAGKCTVEANTVRAVASTIANGGTASTSSAGSTIQDLKVLGLATPVDLNQTTKIPLNKAVFGAGSYVAINERSGPGGQPQAGLSGGTYSADITVTMIHVKITGVLGLQAAEVIVSQASAHSDFPEIHGCGTPTNNRVSGHAYVAGLFTGPLLADLLLGYTQISPLGGSETEHVADLKIPGNGAIVSAKVADSSSQGAVSAMNATSSTFAEVVGDGSTPACVLRAGPECVLTATAIRSASQSTANASGASSTDSGTRLLGFKIGGIPAYTAGVPPPNHTIPLPGIGFIILNEHFCDNGTTTSHTCSGATHSGMTVRGVRVVVTVANNLLGLNPGVELILAEAHSDATFN